ncbi:MAG: choice-of-anchor D domain-containing protein, partial [Candidatus Handelsmanbacteria bacterium]|nr:choice-of-anchor D domain-containing protein [Candidatus Handelsmanbacteria bacterium]
MLAALLAGVLSAVQGRAQNTAVVIPDTLSFGEVLVGGSGTASLTIANQRTDTVVVKSTPSFFPASSPFALRSFAIPNLLPPRTTKKVTVVFAPTATGATSGSVTFVLSTAAGAALGSAGAVLTGTGVTPAALEVEGTELDFGVVEVGGEKAEAFVIKNTGTGQSLEVNIGGIQAGVNAHYSRFEPDLQNRVLQLVPEGQRTVVVYYTPKSAGDHTATLLVENPANTAQSRTIRMHGVSFSAPRLGSAPDVLGFDTPVRIGQRDTSDANAISSASDSLRIYAVSSTSSEYEVILTDPTRLGQPLRANESLAFRVVFAPQSRGNIQGKILVSSNDAQRGVKEIALSGTGYAAQMRVEVEESTELGFGEVLVRSGSLTKGIAIRNLSADETLTVAVQSSSPRFEVSRPSLSIPANGVDSAKVTFRPDSLGNWSGVLTLRATNDPDSSAARVNLSGTGEGPEMAVTTDSLGFGAVQVRTSSTSRTLDVRNNGLGSLQVAVSSPSPRFAASPTSLNIPAGSSRTVEVTFTPDSLGAWTGILTLRATNDPSQAVARVNLSGRGEGPRLAVTAEEMVFSPTLVSRSTSQILDVGNTGLGSLQVAVSSSSPRFAASATSLNIPAGSSRTVEVTFTPDSLGVWTGTLTLRATNDPSQAVARVNLSGRGEGPRLAVTAEEMVFSPTLVS